MSGGEKKVFALTLADGAQAVVLLTLLPFIILQHQAPGFTSILSGTGSLAVGFCLGIVGTMATGRSADRWSPFMMLQLLQASQVFLTICLVLSLLHPFQSLSSILVALNIGVLRSSGPVKDKIRALFISRSKRTHFNALVRRWFLVTNQALVIGVTLIISFIPVHAWPYMVLVSTLLVCVSFLLTQRLKASEYFLPSHQEGKRSRLSKSQVKALVVAFLVIVVLGLGSAIPSIGLTTWISFNGIPPWVLSVVGLYIVAFDFWFMRMLGDTLSNRPKLWSYVVLWGAVALMVGVGGSWLVGHQGAGWSTVLLLLIVAPAVAASTSIATMFAMEVQHGFAHDNMRGQIASYTRVFSAVGLAVATFVAPEFFLNSAVITGAVLAAGACLMMMSGLVVRSLHVGKQECG